jgi:hypothetical protein
LKAIGEEAPCVLYLQMVLPGNEPMDVSHLNIVYRKEKNRIGDRDAGRTRRGLTPRRKKRILGEDDE